MIESMLAQYMDDLGYFWTVHKPDGSSRQIIPDEDDIGRVLDDAVKELVKEPDGARLSVGHLLIEKSGEDFLVYLHIGSYQ